MKRKLIVIGILLITFTMNTLSACTIAVKSPKQNITFDIKRLERKLAEKTGDNEVKIQEKSRLTADDLGNISAKVSGERILIHNDGKAISTNIISNQPLDSGPLLEDPENNQTETINGSIDNHLFAVYIGERNGIPYESYVFSNAGKMSDNEIAVNLDELDENMDALVNRGGETSAAKQVLRNIGLVEKVFGDCTASIASTFSFTKITGKADIDGKSGSIWDITCETAQLKTNNKCYIRDFYTWINVNQPNQGLISWDPINDDIKGGKNPV